MFALFHKKRGFPNRKPSLLSSRALRCEVTCRGLKSNPDALKFIVGIDSVYKLRELFFKTGNSPFSEKEMD